MVGRDKIKPFLYNNKEEVPTLSFLKKYKEDYE